MSRFEMRQKYTVYDNSTDKPIILCATAEECAKAIGVTTNTFYVYLTPSGRAREKRVTILKEGRCEEINVEHDTKSRTIGWNMLQCRLKRHLTRVQLQELTGIDATTICCYEKDRHYPSFMNLVSLADGLDVSIDELIGRKVK